MKSWIIYCQDQELSHNRVIPGYFVSLAELVTDVTVSGMADVLSWKKLTNKMIYGHYAKSFPLPKVVLDSGGMSFSDSWRNLILSCLPS